MAHADQEIASSPSQLYLVLKDHDELPAHIEAQSIRNAAAIIHLKKKKFSSLSCAQQGMGSEHRTTFEFVVLT